jgi:hypothetical protein
MVPHPRSSRPAVLLGLFVYLAVLGANPLLHHDLDCHLKSPSHCPGCVSSPAALRAEGESVLAGSGLPMAERVEHDSGPAARAPERARLKGRAPPA